MKTINGKRLMTKDARTISLAHWLDYIQSLHEKAVDFDLSRVKAVARDMGCDKLHIPVVTVAGTNGKGSTVALLSKCLSSCGYRVGSYFSPHLRYFNERIVLNGKPAAEHLICHAFSKVEKARKDVTLTYFEYTTLAALELFRSNELDVVVLEVGCGGTLDAVNLVEPDLSIITNISIDHTHWLGEDVNEIALNKAGIMRPEKPAIVGLKAQKPSLLQKAKDLKAKLYLEGQSFGWHDKYKSYWQYQGKYIRVPQSFMPSGSISLSLAALEVLKPILPNISKLPVNRLPLLLRTARLPGRFQRVMSKCEIILDVAHNQAGSQWLSDNLSKLPIPAHQIAVWSSFHDKDLTEIAKPLMNQIDTWVIAPIQHERAASLEALEQTLINLGAKHVVKEPSLTRGFQVAEKMAGTEDRIVVFGSFGTVNEVMSALDYDHQSMHTFFDRTANHLMEI